MTGGIYLIASRSQDAGKIGWAIDPASRLAKAQTNNPSELELVCSFKGSRATEGEIHAALSGLRIRGEWFKGLERLEPIMLELEDFSGAREFDGEDDEITAEDVRAAMHKFATMTQA